MAGEALKLPEAESGLVLVVDDEESICRTLSSALRDENYDTVVAYSGEEALERLAESRPDVVFLDMWMPGLDGVETLEQIKILAPDTEVIMISGHATIANALEATKRGAFDFIEKPLDLESVFLALARAMEKRQLRSIAEARESGGINEANTSTATVLAHPGILSQGLRGQNRGQRTLKRSVLLYGQCLHSGQKSGLVLEPLPQNSGIHFSRIGSSKSVPAFVDYVQSTGFATTVRSGDTAAGTIEHLLSALHAYGISNLLIKCNSEVPIFDGSALKFCEVIEDTGILEQGGNWFELAVDKPYRIEKASNAVTGEQEVIELLPSEQLTIEYELNYPQPVGLQKYRFILDGCESYKNNIAPARTFGFLRDIERLQKAGLAAGGRLDNFILVGSDRVLNTDLRFDDEFVRHKILDVMGDLFLLGRPLRARVVARMTGHSDNIDILAQVRDDALAARNN